MTKEQVLNDLLKEVRRNFLLLKKGAAYVHKNTTVTPAIRGIIELLNDQGALTVPHIAKMRFVTRQSIQVVIDEMIQTKWAVMKQNPFHKKSQLVELTEEGKRAYQAMQMSEMKQMKRLKLDFTEKKLEDTVRVLHELNLKIDEFLKSNN